MMKLKMAPATPGARALFFRRSDTPFAEHEAVPQEIIKTVNRAPRQPVGRWSLVEYKNFISVVLLRLVKLVGFPMTLPLAGIPYVLPSQRSLAQ